MDFANVYSMRFHAAPKWAFTTRRVDRRDVAGISPNLAQAVSGDLVLAEIVKLGQHKNIQLAEGRNAESYVGDHIVVTCGDRYAPDQFEALAELDPDGADLVAGGGLVGRMRAAHTKMAPPTRVKPLGLLVDKDGEVMNVAHYALPARVVPKKVPVFGVIGSSMNAGKTTAAASLTHGLSRAGFRIAAVKATGTGAFRDFNAFRDAGAFAVADFTDAGMASTYRQPIERIEQGFEALVAHVTEMGAQAVVVELADGVFQTETAELLKGSVVRDAFAGILFAAPDALGAVGGVVTLRDMGLHPVAISGMVSCSPLAAAEAFDATQIPILSRDDLRNPEHVQNLFGGFIDSPPTLIPETAFVLKTAA